MVRQIALARSYFSALLWYDRSLHSASTGHAMRICLALFMLAFVVSNGAFAQNRVRTETIRPPAANPPAIEPAAPPAMPGGNFKADPHVAPIRPDAGGASVATDLSRLPVPVTRTRERILAAAR